MLVEEGTRMETIVWIVGILIGLYVLLVIAENLFLWWVKRR